MRILVHYRTLADVLLNRQSIQPPLEQIDRVGKALKDKQLQVYVTEWGLQWLIHEITYYVNPVVAQKIEKKLRDYFSISLYVDRNSVEKFVESFNISFTDPSRELPVEYFELFQATQISRGVILTSNSFAFQSFNLRVFPLNAQTDLQQLLKAVSSSRLPIILEGGFTDLWFLTRATQNIRPLPRQPSESFFSGSLQSSIPSPKLDLPIILRDWYNQNSPNSGWSSLDKFPYPACKSYAVRSRTKITKGKEIAVTTLRSPKPEILLLLVSLEQKRNTHSVTVELASISRDLSLPPLQFKLLDEMGKCRVERQTADRSRIQINLEVDTSEKFSVIILGNHKTIHREKFTI